MNRITAPKEMPTRKIVPQTFTVRAADYPGLKFDDTFAYFFCPECGGPNLISPNYVPSESDPEKWLEYYISEEKYYLDHFHNIRELSGCHKELSDATLAGHYPHPHDNVVFCDYCREHFIVEK